MISLISLCFFLCEIFAFYSTRDAFQSFCKKRLKSLTMVVDKQSNAIEGKHYRILNNTVTIKAGEMVGNVKVQGTQR